MPSSRPSARHLAGVGLVSASILMTELALTRIFSVIMYYHFAFLAISIALLGISASGVLVYVARRWLERWPTDTLLALSALVYGGATIVALFFLVRLRVGLSYSRQNLELMLTIYALAALPFFTGGSVVTLAVSRLTSWINVVYAADLVGAAGGCLVLIPLLDRLGAPGVVMTAGALAVAAATLFAPGRAPRKIVTRGRVAFAGAALVIVAVEVQASGFVSLDVVDTKGHKGDRVLFSKWNSFSRVGVYDRQHGDWSLSPAYQGPRPDSRFMDVDSAASTPILKLNRDLSNAQYLQFELTALAYHLKAPGFHALVVGPGGGRDIASALVFGARQVDGVEINPIIADDIMRGRFRDYSGGIYTNPRVRITVDDGRSFIRRTTARYDVIQASLVDTWAATAAGAYTLTENTLYTVDAFDDYLNHLTDDGVLTITRWVYDGLRLVSLAQEACARRGWPVSDRLMIVRYDRVAMFMLKRTAFTAAEVARIRADAARLEFDLLYLPGFGPAKDPSPAVAHVVGPPSLAAYFQDPVPPKPGKSDAKGNPSPPSPVGEPAPPADEEWVDGTLVGDYARLITAADRNKFYASYASDIRPTTDDRPFFFHTTKLKNQFKVAFGRSMLFGNGLSALLTLLMISCALVVVFVVGPLVVADRGRRRRPGWFAWLVYFGALGAGFMLIEVSVLQRFVLLLGHPVYSLTVTLFSLLLGTGLGAAWSRRFDEHALRRSAARALVVIALIALAVVVVVTPLVSWAIPFSRSVRMGIAVATLLPMGLALGLPMPTGLRMLARESPELVAWAWGINGALSVLGATLAIFIAMNWGFAVTLGTAAATYLVGLAAMLTASRNLSPSTH